MKHAMMRNISETLEKWMTKKGLTAKELAKKSGVSYSSLTPILNGSRDFCVSKLVAIANALQCSPNHLLEGLVDLEEQEGTEGKDAIQPKYFVVFISVISMTYCLLVDTDTNQEITSVLPFPLKYGQEPEEFLDHIITAIRQTLKQQDNIRYKEISVFVSAQQYGRALNRKKIQQKGDNIFKKMVLQSDADTNYRAAFGNKNGICISINDGSAITYSSDHGKTLIKLQGYGFPISDVAGNYWLGCEAIRQTILAKEGRTPSSLLSDKILALFNDDLNFLSESVVQAPEIHYSKISLIVKELMYQRTQAYQIVEKSANLLKEVIDYIDQKTNTSSPIIIMGDLAHLYEGFFSEKRIIHPKTSPHQLLMRYGLHYLKNNV